MTPVRCHGLGKETGQQDWVIPSSLGSDQQELEDKLCGSGVITNVKEQKGSVSSVSHQEGKEGICGPPQASVARMQLLSHCCHRYPLYSPM